MTKSAKTFGGAKKLTQILLLPLMFALAACTESSQQADPDFQRLDVAPSFVSADGPVVLIDEAHHNFLTLSGRYKPFAQVLETEGYSVRANTSRFSRESLRQADVLVIANALDRPRRDWQPPYDDAFSENEVVVLKQWVTQGGSLLLIADHTPFPRAIDTLAHAFGFEFSNGHVATALFRSNDATLAEHSITQQLTQIKTFGGSAFKAPSQAISLLTLGEGSIALEPDTPFQISASTIRRPIAGWSQGAVLNSGTGRVAVFAEGMMFSSQIDAKTGKTYGLRSLGAEQNEQLLRNLIAWLASADE